MKNINNKFYYVLPFSINDQGGKSLGSRNKYESLSKIFNVKLISPDNNGIFSRLFFIIWLEFYFFYLIFSSKKTTDIFFTRGFVGLLASIYLKYSGKHFLIREIHAAPGEYKVLKGSLTKKVFIFIYEKGSYFIDYLSDMRIFNHPSLYTFYKNKGINNKYDITLYNGAKLEENIYSKEYSKNLLSLNKNKKILAFTGSVSSWHGIDNLIKLQREFNNNFDNIQIVVGGGEITNLPDKNIVNIFPLDEKGCNHLINSADACLLPIRNNRVSPGSPLKLYQYLLSSKPVITQNDVVGYSDEVLKYNAGISVNFNDPIKTREVIVNFIDNKIYEITDRLEKNKLMMGITWDDRVNQIVNSIYNHHKFK